MELKIVRQKTGFLKFILKLESCELNLIIGILEIKFERNQNFGNRKLNSEIGIQKKMFKNGILKQINKWNNNNKDESND